MGNASFSSGNNTFFFFLQLKSINKITIFLNCYLFNKLLLQFKTSSHFYIYGERESEFGREKRKEQGLRSSCALKQDINGVEAAVDSCVCVGSHSFRISSCSRAEEKYRELFFFIILALSASMVVSRYLGLFNNCYASMGFV